MKIFLIIISSVFFIHKANAERSPMATQGLLCTVKQTIGHEALSAKNFNNAMKFRDLVDLGDFSTKSEAILTPLISPVKMIYPNGGQYYWSHKFHLKNSQINPEVSGFCHGFYDGKYVSMRCISNKILDGNTQLFSDDLLFKKSFNEYEREILYDNLSKSMYSPTLKIDSYDGGIKEFLINRSASVRNNCTGYCALKSRIFIERGECEVSK
jgi:hypothetical protein